MVYYNVLYNRRGTGNYDINVLWRGTALHNISTTWRFPVFYYVINTGWDAWHHNQGWGTTHRKT